MAHDHLDVTFTLAAHAHDTYPTYLIKMLKPGDYMLSAVRNVDDKRNAYIRIPDNPGARYASAMRVFDNSSYAGLQNLDGTGTPPQVSFLEYGVIKVASVDAAFDGLGSHRFRLVDGPERPIMFAIYVSLSTKHSNGITLRLQHAKAGARYEE